MAVHACRDTIFYANARLHPLAHLPKFDEYISMERRRDFTSQMTSQKRHDLKVCAAAFFEAAEASHLKWKAKTWTKVCTQSSLP
eukprot:972529-Pleurochrysis_carterae.AAC.2